MYLLRSESSLISCKILPRISDYNEVLLEKEWDEVWWQPKVERIAPIYHKTYNLVFQTSLRTSLTCGLEMAFALRIYGKIIWGSFSRVSNMMYLKNV
jgi:hypothetical protein